MASVNKVILLGTLGRDPEVRFSANQLPIASLSLATSSFRRSAESQDRIEETEWHRVTLFGLSGRNRSTVSPKRFPRLHRGAAPH